MTAQRLLSLHRPAFLHHADTLLTMHYPGARITRRKIVVDGTIHVGWRYRIRKSFFRREYAELLASA